MTSNNEFCNVDEHENPLRGSAVKKKIYTSWGQAVGHKLGGCHPTESSSHLLPSIESQYQHIP